MGDTAARWHATADALRRRAALDGAARAAAEDRARRIRPAPQPIHYDPTGTPAAREDSLELALALADSVNAALAAENRDLRAGWAAEMQASATLRRLADSSAGALRAAKDSLAAVTRTLSRMKPESGCSLAFGLLRSPSRTAALLIGVAAGVAGHIPATR